MMNAHEAETVINFQFIVDGMIDGDGLSPLEAQYAMTDRIEAAARAVAEDVGAHVTEVSWTISRRRRS